MIFRRRTEVDPTQLIDVPLDPSDKLHQPNSFEQFLDTIESRAQQYEASYASIVEKASALKNSEKVREKVELAFASISDDFVKVLNGKPVEYGDVSDLTEKYIANVPLIAVYAAKRSEREAFRGTRMAARGVVSTGEESVDRVTSSIAFSLLQSIGRMKVDFNSAYNSATKCTLSFAEQIIENPELVTTAIDYFTQEDTPDDEKSLTRRRTSKTFKDMLAVDELEPSNGAVRGALDSLANDDMAFIDQFLEHVVEKGSRSPIWRAGSLAVAVMHDSGHTDATVGSVLKTIRKRWNEFDDRIDIEFGQFKAGLIRGVRNDLSHIAGIDGSKRRRGIRFPVTEGDFQTVRSAFAFMIDRKEQRTSSFTKVSPNTLHAQELLEEIEGKKVTYDIMLGSSTPDGIVTEIATTESLEKIAQSYAQNDRGLGATVVRMIEQIRREPFGQGTVQIQGGRKVMVDGQQLPIRRFSPKDRTGFSVKGNVANRTRVAYTVKPQTGDAPGGVVILNVLYHDDFDRVYK